MTHHHATVPPRPGRVDRRSRLGAWGEQLAVDHLTARGWRPLARNWRCRYGEVDLIAVEPGGSVVFVEVKTRRSDRFGGVAEAVSPAKVHRLRRLAGLWLAEQDARFPGVRLDVVGVQYGPADGPRIMHVPGVG